MLVPDKDINDASAMKKSRDPEEKKKSSHSHLQHPDNHHRSCQANASSVFSVGTCSNTGQQHDTNYSGQLPSVTTLLLPPNTAAAVLTSSSNMPPYPSDSERPLSIAVTASMVAADADA